MGNLIFDVGDNIGNFSEVGVNRQTPVHMVVVGPKTIAGYNALATMNYRDKTLSIPFPGEGGISSESSIYLGNGNHDKFAHGPQLMSKFGFKEQFDKEELFNSPYYLGN